MATARGRVTGYYPPGLSDVDSLGNHRISALRSSSSSDASNKTCDSGKDSSNEEFISSTSSTMGSDGFFLHEGNTVINERVKKLFKKSKIKSNHRIYDKIKKTDVSGKTFK